MSEIKIEAFLRLAESCKKVCEALEKAAESINFPVPYLPSLDDGYTPVEETEYVIRHIGIKKGGWKRNDHYRISRNR